MKKVFIAGCGYIGKRVAIRSRQAGAEVVCMVRSPEHAADLEKAGFKSMACTLDTLRSNPLEGVEGATLFYFVPPPGGGIVDTRARNFCSHLSRQAAPEKIVCVSATSVYAPAAGGVVTEESPAIPKSVRGQRRLDAERTFADYAGASGIKLVILRVSGIYGPGRLPLTHVLQRLPVLLEAEAGLSNRIHADDLANICMAAAEKGEAGEIFNISDGRPRSLTAYFNAVADALSQPRPPQITFQQAQQVMAPLMLSYYGESHIIDNRRMLDRLGVSLLYPDMESGIMASVEVN